jgi:hypothetical protein
MDASGKSSWKLLLLLAIIAYAAGTALFTYSWAAGPNYKNVTVDTTVNITNSLPTVLSVIINTDNTTTGIKNITLNAGTTKLVWCNATIRDYNGGNTITNVSATFYDNANANSFSPDDNNTHYTNTTCDTASFGWDGFYRNASCSFQIQYYANVNNWTCNVTATDDYSFGNASRQQSLANQTHIDQLLALNVTPLIDYGNLAVGDTSAPQQANITNFGNRNINISVKGYGAALNDGLAMVCEVGNIAIQNEKYNLIGGGDITQYANLSSAATQIGNLTVMQQTNDSQPVINTSYWVLYVPPNPFGRCNGTVVFQAELS